LKGLKLLFSKASNDSDIDFFLGQILTFAYLHKDKIRSELDPLLIGEEGGKWILELSHSAIFTLLSSWGEIFESLNVYCDRSKPLAAKQDFFNAMVNREDKHNLLIRGEKLNLTFNLAGPIQFVDSRQHSGIQLADVLASSLCYALNNPGDFSLELRRQLWPAIHRFSMIPDPDDLDLMKRGPYVNSLLLHELIERSEAGRNLLENIREFILSADSSYPGYIEQQYLEACKEQDLQAALR
jgi:hypothetical protein